LKFFHFLFQVHLLLKIYFVYLILLENLIPLKKKELNLKNRTPHFFN
jgi:hypothetical protein